MSQEITIINQQVKQACADLILSDDTLHKVIHLLHSEIEKGLKKETNGEAAVKCYPTYVKQLPTGNECGKFLALDLGGTNFRVLLIELGGDNTSPSAFKMESEVFVIPQKIMVSHGSELFDHIAECLSIFVRAQHVENEKLSLGFTFSFPLKQEGLTKAKLVTWTKGFNCEGVVGVDVVRLLEEAITRRGDVQIDVCAVLNDTTGTLMSCAWLNPSCRIGLIVGTGTNACYVEKLENVELWDGDMTEPKQVVVNTEWGAFGDNGCLDFLLTKYDQQIDSCSINPKQQRFEKMISGMYMGELVRLIIVKLIETGLFRAPRSAKIFEPDSFPTEYISKIESESIGKKGECKKILDQLLGLNDVSDSTCQAVLYICEIVSSRAAKLAGAGVACLLAKMNQRSVVVAVDGSVYRYHPVFRTKMNATIEKLLAEKNLDIKFQLMLSDDGSGRGAALVAAAAAARRVWPS